MKALPYGVQSGRALTRVLSSLTSFSSLTWFLRRSGLQKKSTNTCLSRPTSCGWCLTICKLVAIRFQTNKSKEARKDEKTLPSDSNRNVLAELEHIMSKVWRCQIWSHTSAFWRWASVTSSTKADTWELTLSMSSIARING